MWIMKYILIANEFKKQEEVSGCPGTDRNKTGHLKHKKLKKMMSFFYKLNLKKTHKIKVVTGF